MTSRRSSSGGGGSGSGSPASGLCTDRVLRGDALPGAGERARLSQITAVAWGRMSLEERRHAARRRRVLVSELEAQIQLNSALVSSATFATSAATSAAPDGGGGGGGGGGGDNDDDGEAEGAASGGGGDAGGSDIDEDDIAVNDDKSQNNNDEDGDGDGDGDGDASGGGAPLLGVTGYDESDHDFAHPLETSMEGYVPIAERGPDGKRWTASSSSSSSSSSSGGGGEGEGDSGGSSSSSSFSSAAGVEQEGLGAAAEDELPCLLLELLLPELLHAVLLFLDGDSIGSCFRTHRALLLRGTANELSSSHGSDSSGKKSSRSSSGSSSSSSSSSSSGGNGGDDGGNGRHGFVLLSGEESLFRELCVRTYLRQSRHKVVQPERWGGWRAMWLHRPRVRTNGYYCLAAEWMKNVSRFDSMDAEAVAPGVFSLTSQSFRYFRFLADGKVLYSLTHQPPDKMRRLLRHDRPPAAAPNSWRASGKEKLSADVFVGTYSLHQNTIFVRVRSHYNVVNFNLELSHGRRGHFCRLAVQHHFSKGLSAPRSSPATHHVETRGCEFRFLRAYPK